jgi:hypothetical protein
MENSELKALLKLLDDKDPMVYDAVKRKLLEADEQIVREIQTAVSISKNNLFVERADEIIHTLQHRKIDKEMITWVNTKRNDLLYGAYLIAKYQYPEIEF